MNKNLEKFKQMPLRVHSLLTDVPLRTLERIELPGGRKEMTLKEINEVVGFESNDEPKVNFITQALFWMRGLTGRILGWEKASDLIESHSYIAKLSEKDRADSEVLAGTTASISRILYRFDREMLAEIINRTVHCFWVIASEPKANGYVLWLAIYVKKINWFTPVYMAMVSPLLKWIIYPSMMRNIKQQWDKAFATDAGTTNYPHKPAAKSA